MILGSLILALPLAVAALWFGAFLRRNAPFYAKWNIVVVGTVFGIVTVLIVGTLWIPSKLPDANWPVGVVAGLLAIAIVGRKPDPIDHAKKNRQTAIVGALVFFVVSLIAHSLAIWP